MRFVLRKFILFGLSLALVFAVVLIYSQFAPTQRTPSSTLDSLPPNGLANLEPIKRISQRERTLQRGEKLEIFFMGPGGRIEREYHAQRFKLVSEDRAELEDVKLIWHLKDNQTLTLTSQRGDVHIERGALGRVQPTSGLLTGNVQIVHDTRPQAHPTRRTLGQRDANKLIITTDQLDFDIRSCRLSTDQPVELHGSRLDAYGTGLLLRWREISKDIDSLIIRQGGEMTWYPGPGRGFVSLTPPEEQKTQTTGSPLPLEPPKEQKTQTSTPLLPEPPKEQVQDQRIHSYLATFQRNVRVTYKDQVLQNVDILNVVFDLDTSDEPNSTAEVPEPSPDSAAQPGVSEPTTGPDEPTTGKDEPSLQAPVRITWTGQLNIIPEESEDSQLTAQRRFEVEALGAPVEFSSADMSGQCARLEAEHHSGIVRLFSSPDFGVLLNATDGSTITADQLNIDSTTSTARMIGKGTLKTPAQRPAAGPDTSSQVSKGLDLSWNSRATLKFLKYNRPPAQPDNRTAATPTQDYYLSEATASDKVVALSNKFTAQANHMYIKLGPPGSDGTPRGQEILLLQAKDDFFSVLSDDDLSISAGSMETHFTRRSSGKGQFPSTIKLEDNVQAIQQPPASHTQSTLQCQEMLITLVENKDVTPPTPDGYVGSLVSNLLAQRNVIGRHLVDGQVRSSLSAHKLDRDEVTKTTVLYGGPAELRRGDDHLEAKIIRIVEKGEHYVLSTPGPGQMKASFAPSDQTSAPAILGLNWPGSMVFDGLTNKASFVGTDDEMVKGALVHSPERWSSLESEQLELFLRDNQLAQADKQHSSSAASPDLVSTEPFFEPMGGKSLEKMILTGKALVRSVEQTPDTSKKILRRVLLTSDVLTYQADAKHFHGQGPGTLLLEDYRPTDKEVSAEKPTSGPLAEAPKPPRPLRLHRVGPGKTGFWWTDSADYYQDKRTAVLLGDVHMVSRGYALTLPAKPSELATAPNRRDLTQLRCHELNLTHAEPEADEASQKKSNFADLSAMDELEIESVEAVSDAGDATLVSSDVNIQGHRIFYSTKTNEILIEGTRRQKAILDYIDPEKGWGRWTGKTVRFNTLTHTGYAPGGKFDTWR